MSQASIFARPAASGRRGGVGSTSSKSGLRRAVFFVGLVLAAEAAGQTSQLPVVIEMAGGGDERWESIQITIGNLHIENGVPLSIAAVPCTQATPPGTCSDDGSLHLLFNSWTSQYPTLIEIGQQGRDNTESLASLSAAEQRSLIEEGYNAMTGWSLAAGRPFLFTPPKSSANADTASILENMDFHTFAQSSGTCPATGGMDRFCRSVPLCRLDASGNRVSGPACVLRSFADLSAEIDSRAGDGAVFVLFNPQDLSVSSSDASLDPSKQSAYASLLDSLAAAADAGRYSLRTFDSHYRVVHGMPLPTPAPTVAPTPIPEPSHLPVIFESDDARDLLWEDVATRLLQLHITEQVPLATCCGRTSPHACYSCTSPSRCPWYWRPFRAVTTALRRRASTVRTELCTPRTGI
jgi:hypothetical protein